MSGDEGKRLRDDLRAFAREREWERFHVPEQLAAALAIEAAELQEVLLWKSREQVDAFLETPEGRERIREEIADVYIYLVRLCDVCDVDLDAAAREKMTRNREKYPAREVASEAREGVFTKRDSG